MATHSSIFVWKIPQTEKPGRPQSMRSQRVGHDWATSLSLSVYICWTPSSHYLSCCYCCCSVAQSCLTLCHPMDGRHARLPCPSPSLGACSNSCPLSWWCHPTILSSVVPVLYMPSIFPRIRVFPMSQFFASGSQSIGVSSLASVLSVYTQDWFPLGWTGWNSLQSKRLSKVFNNTVQKHQFSALSFLYSPALTFIHDHWKNHSFD